MVPDPPSPAVQWPRRQLLASWALLAVAVCLLARPVARHSFSEECAYNESALLYAIDNGIAWSQCDTRACIDHPPLGRAIYEPVFRLSSPEWQLFNCRLVSATAYVLAIGVSFFVLRPEDHESPLFSAAATVALACVWLSPSLLEHAFRADIEALVYLAEAGYLALLVAFVRTPNLWRLGAVGVTAATLVWLTLHGIAIVLAASIGGAVALLAGRHGQANLGWRSRMIASFLLVASSATVAASALHPLYHFSVLWSHHLDHYWSLDLTPPGTIVPLSFLWDGSSVIIPSYPSHIDDGFHLVAIVAGMYGAVAPRASARTRALAGALIGAMAILAAVGLYLDGRWMVGQQLGGYYLLMTLAMTSVLVSLRWAIAAVIGVFWAVTWAALPTLAFLSSNVPSGDSVVREASNWINERGSQADTILFAGSRTYIMVQPLVAAELQPKCSAYIREGVFPDNYSALSLIDAERRLSDDQIHSLHQKQVLYVQIGASQKVSLDLAPWNIVAMDSFPHPSRAIDRIDVLTLEPRDKIREDVKP